MRKETGHGLQPIEGDIELQRGFLQRLPLQVTEFMLNPMEDGNDLRAVVGT